MGSELNTTDGVMFDLDIGYSDQFETLIEAYFHNICSGEIIVYKARDGGLSIFFTKKEDAVKVKLKDSIFDTLKEMLHKFQKDLNTTRRVHDSYGYLGGKSDIYYGGSTYSDIKTTIDPHAWFYQQTDFTAPKLNQTALDSILEDRASKKKKKGS